MRASGNSTCDGGNKKVSHINLSEAFRTNVSFRKVGEFETLKQSKENLKNKLLNRTIQQYALTIMS